MSLTTIVGQFIDGDHVPWANAVWVATLIIPGDIRRARFISTDTLVPPSYRGVLDANGFPFVSSQVGNCTDMTPPGCMWQFTIYTNTSAPPVVMEPVVVFGATYVVNQTGLQALRFPAIQGGIVFAYGPEEILLLDDDVDATAGQYAYFDTTIYEAFIWIGDQWQSISGGGGGGGLTSFQGRTTAAAVLLAADVEGILAGAPYFMTTANALGYGGNGTAIMLAGVVSNGVFGYQKNWTIDPTTNNLWGVSSGGVVNISMKASDGSVSFGAGTFTVTASGTLNGRGGDFGGSKLTSVGAATVSTDAVNLSQISTLAPLASPTFTGVVTAPNISVGATNPTVITRGQILANGTDLTISVVNPGTTLNLGITAAAIIVKVPSGNTLNLAQIAASSILATDGAQNVVAAPQTGTGTIVATSVSPVFTGTPSAPSAPAGTNTAQIATCQFVLSNNLGLFAPTTSAQLAATLSDETGSAGGGIAVFNNNPTLTGITVSGTSNLGGIFATSASTFSVSVKSGVYLTGANIASTSSPAACGASASGMAQVAAGALTVQINTTAVTANSRISLVYSVVGITPPTNIATLTIPYVSAIVAGTSFTITLGTAPVANPVNVMFIIFN